MATRDITRPDTSDYYYEDEDMLTYKLAEILVDYYLRTMVNCERRQRYIVRCRDILEAFEYPATFHNTMRVGEALDDRCSVYEANGEVGAQRFEVPERYR